MSLPRALTSPFASAAAEAEGLGLGGHLWAVAPLFGGKYPEFTSC